MNRSQRLRSGAIVAATGISIILLMALAGLLSLLRARRVLDALGGVGGWLCDTFDHHWDNLEFWNQVHGEGPTSHG